MQVYNGSTEITRQNSRKYKELRAITKTILYFVTTCIQAQTESKSKGQTNKIPCER